MPRNKTSQLLRRLSLLLLALSLLSAPRGAARAQTTEGVDKVLGALAEVLQDRAKRVAVATLKKKLVANLCNKDVLVNAATLHFGDKAVTGCVGDNVFTESCKLASNGGLELGDAYFLKALGRDTVRLSMRLAASTMNCASYESAHLAIVADYLFDVMEKGSSGDLDIGVLGELTVGLSADLQDQLPPSEVLANLGKIEELRALRASLITGLDGRCAANCDATCQAACSALPSGLILKSDHDEATCKDFNLPENRRKRSDNYDAVFGPGGKYPDGQIDDDKCAGDELCARARLTLDLGFYLSDLACSEFKTEQGELRKVFRQLTYLLWDRSEFKRYMDRLSPASADPLNAFTNKAIRAAQAELPDYPGLELVIAIRTVGLALEARAQDPEGLEKWAGRLIGSSPSDLLNSQALHWRKRGALSPSVAAVRDSLKDLLTRPRFALSVALDLKKAEKQARELEKALVAQVRSLAALAKSVRSDSAPLGAVAQVFASNAKALRQLATLMPGSKASLEANAKALETSRTLIKRAEEKDWVGVAIAAADLMPAEAKQGGFGRSLAFTRTLMAMYQAESRDEAKAIFEATLQDEDSREKRFDSFTIDATGHLAMRAGEEWNRYQGTRPTSIAKDSELYGLYAPLGLQLAYKHFGALVYPVDLGSYLTVKSDQNSSPDVRVWDALRSGLFVYGRFSSVPLAVGAGSDYRMPVDKRSEFRVFGAISMELPLYTIY